MSLPQRFCQPRTHCRRLRMPWSDKTSAAANIPRSQTKWCVHNKMAENYAWLTYYCANLDLHGRFSHSNLETQPILMHTVWLCFVFLLQGDTGGPLQCKQGSVWIQARINFVALCALVDFPETYTGVSEFQRWITDQVTTADVSFVTFTSSGTDPDSSFVCSSSAEANTANALFDALCSAFVLSVVFAL